VVSLLAHQDVAAMISDMLQQLYHDPQRIAGAAREPKSFVRLLDVYRANSACHLIGCTNLNSLFYSIDWQKTELANQRPTNLA